MKYLATLLKEYEQSLAAKTSTGNWRMHVALWWCFWQKSHIFSMTKWSMSTGNLVYDPCHHYTYLKGYFVLMNVLSNEKWCKRNKQAHLSSILSMGHALPHVMLAHQSPVAVDNDKIHSVQFFKFDKCSKLHHALTCH